MKYLRHLKESEDSGISSIRSSNIHCELSAIEKFSNLSHIPMKEDLNCSNNNINDSNGSKMNGSPSRTKPFFKRPESMQLVSLFIYV